MEVAPNFYVKNVEEDLNCMELVRELVKAFKFLPVWR